MMNRNPSRQWIGAVAVGLLSAAGTKGPGPSSARPASPGSKHSPFVAVVARNWSAWDADGDGTLSQPEVERAVMDPRVTGDNAAAAAALLSMMRSKKVVLPPLTRAYFEAYDAHASVPTMTDEEAARATVDPNTTGVTTVPGTKQPHWDLMFAGNKHRIAAVDAKANLGVAAPAESGTDVLTHLHQGPLGDCFFVAAVGAAESRNPAMLRGMIAGLGDGRTRVAFPSPFAPYVLPPLTDAERALSSSSGGEGDWLVALEQAYGRYRHQLTAGPGAVNAAVEGTDTVCHGGNPGSVISTLTGHASTLMNLANDAAKRKAKQDQALPKLRQLIVSALDEHRLVVATVNAPPKPADGTTPKPAGGDGDGKDNDAVDPTKVAASASLPSPPNITHGHAYAVTAFDARSELVTIWNPHGQTFHPKGPDGLTNGYTTVHGTFRVPLAEMYQFYSSLCVETSKPAKLPGPATPGKVPQKH